MGKRFLPQYIADMIKSTHEVEVSKLFGQDQNLIAERSQKIEDQNELAKTWIIIHMLNVSEMEQIPSSTRWFISETIRQDVGKERCCLMECESDRTDGSGKNLHRLSGSI